MFAGILALCGLSFFLLLYLWINTFYFVCTERICTAQIDLLLRVELYLELCPQSFKNVSTLSNKLFIMKTTFLVTIAFTYRPAAHDLVRIQNFDQGSVRRC